MSNSVTNVEVEDVLSSIRRLVSDDIRPSMTASPAPSSDRLVLTPALRVAEIVDEDTNTDVSDRDDSDDVEEPVIQAWSEFGAGPDGAATRVDADLDASRDLHDENEEEAPFEQDAEPEQSWDKNDHNDGDRDHNEDETANSDDGEGDEPDLSEDVVTEDVVTEPFVLVSPEVTKGEVFETVDATDDPVSDVPDAELVDKNDQAAFFASGAATLSAKIAALETVIGKTDDQWEPDDTGDSDYSGTEAPAMDWDDTDTGTSTGMEEPVPHAEVEVEKSVDASSDSQTEFA